MTQKQKVLVGMSGGVDSSVAALLLKNQGYDVLGCTIKMYRPDNQTENSDTDDAKAVCETLGINLSVADYSDRFASCVINYFTDTYLSGKTPNPCVFCNKNMKFPCILEEAEKSGYQYVATGHYARIEKYGDRFLLKKGADSAKDQSYMLYALSQQMLSKILFPLGMLTKEQIRTLAKEIGLTVADKKDSQDICFIKGIDYAEFIKQYTKCDIPQGDFRDISGGILGTHKGIISYTIGQRKGLGISSEEPYYVVNKDISNNSVILGREKDLYTKRVYVTNPNFIAFDKLEYNIRLRAKLRYSQTESECTVIPEENGFVLEFDTPQRAVTPGQSAVLYDGDIVVGGGIISEKFK